MSARVPSARGLAAKLVNVTASTGGDVWLYRMVVATLGMIILACVIGAIVLAMQGLSTPEFLVALGSGAVGGLAGLLAPSPKSK